MPPTTVEERLSTREEKVAQLMGENSEVVEDADTAKLPAWLQNWVGAFRDDPEFDAAMERGAEHRRSQPTAADE